MCIRDRLSTQWLKRALPLVHLPMFVQIQPSKKMFISVTLLKMCIRDRSYSAALKGEAPESFDYRQEFPDLDLATNIGEIGRAHV